MRSSVHNLRPSRSFHNNGILSENRLNFSQNRIESVKYIDDTMGQWRNHQITLYERNGLTQIHTCEFKSKSNPFEWLSP